MNNYFYYSKSLFFLPSLFRYKVINENFIINLTVKESAQPLKIVDFPNVWEERDTVQYGKKSFRSYKQRRGFSYGK